MDNRDRGFSLIEVMIAMAVAVVVFMGVLDMINTQNKAVRGVENQSDRVTLENLLNQMIGNSITGSTCGPLLSGVTLSSLPTVQTSWPSAKYPITYPFTLGQALPTMNWTWSSQSSTQAFGQLIQIQAPSTTDPLISNLVCVSGCATNQVTGTLTLYISAVGVTALGAPVAPINIPFVATLSAAAPYSIVNCSTTNSVGTGTVNYLAKWSPTTSTLASSKAYENATNSTLLTVGEDLSVTGTETIAGTAAITSTSNPALTMSGAIALAPSTTIYKTGAACNTEGMMAYDLSNHWPVYCGTNKKWTSVIPTVTVTRYAFTNNTNAGSCGNSAPPTSWPVSYTAPAPVNPNCFAFVDNGFSGNGDKLGFGCYYDPNSGALHVCSSNFDAYCYLVCLN